MVVCGTEDCFSTMLQPKAELKMGGALFARMMVDQVLSVWNLVFVPAYLLGSDGGADERGQF